MSQPVTTKCNVVETSGYSKYLISKVSAFKETKIPVFISSFLLRDSPIEKGGTHILY